MRHVLQSLFEEQITFRLQNGTAVDGNIFIGQTEFLPVEILREDSEAYRDEFSRWLNESWVPQMADRREEILALRGNRKRYLDLRDATIKQQAVPFVGSGMSATSGLPTWSALLRGIRQYTKIGSSELDMLLSASAFEEAADLLSGGTNRKLFNERIEHELRIDEPEVVTGPVAVLPAIFSNVILTTNLDDILERQYESYGIEFDHVLAGKDLTYYRRLKNPRERFLLKLHGDLRRPEGRVLLTGEYDAAYGAGSSVREELSLLYRTNHLLFLGCSLGPDRTMKLLKEVAGADDSMPPHYAFLPLVPSDADRLEREHFLTECGIFPIWYDGSHDEAIYALLAGLVDFGQLAATAKR